MTGDRLDDVVVRDLPIAGAIDPEAKHCELCLRTFTHPRRKLARLPSHPEYRACRVCRDTHNDPVLLDWWLARPVGIRRMCIAQRHGVDPLSWAESRPRAQQITVSEDDDGGFSAVEVTPVELRLPVPHTFWDVQQERPDAVRDAHPGVDVD